MSSRRSRLSDRRAPPTTLRAPVPAWLATLIGAVPRGVAIRGALPRLRLSVSVETGTLRMIVLEDGALAAAWQGPDGARGQAALGPDAVRDVRRWHAVLNERVHALSGPERRALAAATRLGGAGFEALPDDPLELQLWSRLSRGDWAGLFAALDQGATLAAWSAPMLLGVVGDVATLRERAAKPTDAPGLTAVAGLAWQALGFAERAAADLEAASETLFGAERANLALRLGKLHRELGDDAASVRWLREAALLAPQDDSLLLRLSFELMRSGAAGDAASVLAERCERADVPPPIALAYAELLLFAGDWEAARPWLERAEAVCARADPSEDGLRRRRARAILAASSGDWPAACLAFEALYEKEGDLVAATWLVEAYLREGEVERAAEVLRFARAAAQSPVHIVLRAAVSGQGPNENEELRELLLWLEHPTDDWPDSTDDRSAHFAVLARFGGNRGTPATLRDPRLPPPHLAPAALPAASSPLSSRDASARCLKGFGRVPRHEIEAAFEEVARRYPDSPHPHCYRGELDLWMGDYDAAIARFQAGLACGEARWGYVGQAAVHLLRRDYATADAVLERLARRFNPVVGATTQVYLGEACRRRGEPERARLLLREAVGAKPGRLAAWMNLALVERTLGEANEATRILQVIEAWAPRLLWDASRARGEVGRCGGFTLEEMPLLFETALEMMRGNRSSHRPSYFDREGRLHVVSDARAWPGRARRAGLYLRRGIQTELIAGRSGLP